MSKIKKLFLDLESDKRLEVYCYNQGKLNISIHDDGGEHFIELDISTAIAFCKELRR